MYSSFIDYKGKFLAMPGWSKKKV